MHWLQGLICTLMFKSDRQDEEGGGNGDGLYHNYERWKEVQIESIVALKGQFNCVLLN